MTIVKTPTIISNNPVYCVVFSDNCTQPDDGQKYYWPKHVVDMLFITDDRFVLWRSCPCLIVSLCAFLISKALEERRCSWFSVEDTIMSGRGVSVPLPAAPKAIVYQDLYPGTETHTPLIHRTPGGPFRGCQQTRGSKVTTWLCILSMSQVYLASNLTDNIGKVGRGGKIHNGY